MVDDCDYPLLSQFKWRVTNERGYKYAIYGKSKMHRVIMGTSFNKSIVVDHIDGNGLNNQRSNLRICTNNQNKLNQIKRNNNTSGFKGVHQLKKSGRYQAYCSVNNIRYYAGTYDTAKEAAIAYNIIAKKLHGEFSNPNVI